MSILRDYDELNDLEKLSLINMSYSRLDTYQSCPAKYFYTYIQKEPRTFGPAAAMGTVVHSVLEKTDLNNLDVDLMIKTLQEEFDSEDPDGLVGEELRQAAVDIIHEFIDRHEDDEFETIGKELEFQVVIGNCLFRGFIDRVDKTPNGGVLIEDYKAGKFQVTQKSIPTNLQVGMYAVACRKMFPDLWPITAGLYYLREGKIKGHTYTHQELDDMELLIHKTALEVVQATNFGYTSNKFTCRKLCDFGKNGVCPRGKTVCGTW